MIKQVKKGGKFTETLKHFLSQNSRNSDRSEVFYCTSMICMSLHLKTLKNFVGKGAYSGM